MSNESRNQGSRWGSVISGLWSGTRRRDSTNTPGDGFQPPLSPGYLPSPTKPTQAGIDRSSRTKSVAEMAQELSLPDPSLDDGQMPRGNEPETPRVPQQDRSDGSEALAQGRRWPEPGASFESRVKTTVNREDGIVDVDVPFPDFLMNPHSFDTAVSSPSSSGYLSTPVLGNATDTFEQACRLALEGDMPLNSAGWLQAYHPDFVLQAIPLSATCSKSSKDDTSHRWVDISSAVIADMTTGKVFRIRYRRLMKPRQWIDKTAGSRSGTGGGVYGGVLLTPSILPYEATLKEEFIQDEISNVDERLADAVERVIAHIGDNGKALSSNSSRSNSKARRGDGRRRLSTSSPPPEEAVGDDAPQTALAMPEVPRNECRTVILSALADLIQDVVVRRGEDANASPSGEQSAIRLAIRDWLDSLDLASE
ncbi:unnamed protein product [Parascedosporium putredinis]|uniref:Uncharacterized protein n=1 Tax=Parascedosporium putredinis TaxID=1442378 RepID=A0A9P1H2X3_9PEZI|nr:unnamed protein product [Parascedosporium putredinis]CAI7996441.1 unnamed protein product [Parascedosporium putredinis]